MLKKEKKRAADAIARLQSGGASYESQKTSVHDQQNGHSHTNHYRSESETVNRRQSETVKGRRETESSRGVAERLKQHGRPSSSRQQGLEKEREGVRSENEERLKKKICMLIMLKISGDMYVH